MVLTAVSIILSTLCLPARSTIKHKQMFETQTEHFNLHSVESDCKQEELLLGDYFQQRINTSGHQTVSINIKKEILFAVFSSDV